MDSYHGIRAMVTICGYVLLSVFASAFIYLDFVFSFSISPKSKTLTSRCRVVLPNLVKSELGCLWWGDDIVFPIWSSSVRILAWAMSSFFFSTRCPSLCFCPHCIFQTPPAVLTLRHRSVFRHRYGHAWRHGGMMSWSCFCMPKYWLMLCVSTDRIKEEDNGVWIQISAWVFS